MDIDNSYPSIREDNEVLEYTQMVVPSSMRSQYWKYFGFPSDNFNNIITKKKVVCTLCTTAISYNKNTTNLRTHLVAKHPDILYELTTYRKRKENVSAIDIEEKKIKIIDAKTMKENMETARTDEGEHNSLIDSLTESEILDDSPEKIQVHTTTSELAEYSLHQQQYQIVEIDESNMPNDDNIAEALQDMLIKDLLPSSLLEGNGFINFVWTLCANTTVPHKKEIENSIKKAHDNQFTELFDTIKSHSAQHPFSFGLEIWENIDKKELLSIYVNYIPQTGDPVFHNVLLKTTELTKSTNLDNILAGINMENCSAAVVNFDNSIISNFLNSHDIPSIPCFETMIQRCLTSAFKIQSVEAVIKDIGQFLEKSEEICETDLIPQLHEEFPITKLNFLTFFHEKMSNSFTSWTNEVNELFVKAKEIIDCLSSLKMTLETLSDEPIALSSLLKPLTTKLLTQHFCLYDEDSQIVLDIKETIINELSTGIMNNNFLKVSSFFDPRFQNFTNTENLEIIKTLISPKLQDNNDENKSTRIKDETDSRNMRKSSLKLFFKNDDTKRHPKVSKSTVDVEIMKYTNEVCADLDQCPLTWWNESGFVYRQMKIISKRYICVPASFNNIFKRTISEQIDYYNKRFMLREISGSYLLFLHFNK